VSTLSPRQVNEMVRGALNQHLPQTLHVLGEIGDLSRPSSGHVYFTLKDPHSELQCVMWRSTAAKLKFTPEVGMEVIATGGVEVYLPRGTYQLYVRKLEPRGVGALELAFRQVREKLEREGLFDPQRKRPLPRVPRRVAVVTSPTGAAIRDILQTLRRRFPPLEILIFPVRVQGEGAAREIADAIEQMNTHAEHFGGIDVAIVGRGGGSLEDLWAFSEEVVARAVAASRIPIVSAVGHEVDVSICDLVADVRAATPTAAAELIAPKLSDLLAWLAQRTDQASRIVRHAVALAEARLRATVAADALARPRERVRQRGQRIDELQQRLRLATHERFLSARRRLEHAELVILRFRSGAHFRRLSERVAERLYALHRAMNRAVMQDGLRLAEMRTRLQRVRPAGRVARQDEHLRQTVARLERAARGLLRERRHELRARLEALTAYDPRGVLRRGYSITRDARTRRVLRSVQDVRDGQRIVTELADGEFRGTAEDPRQPGLFD
jgi:exodeoxyribonuclease VII large subunit